MSKAKVHIHPTLKVVADLFSEGTPRHKAERVAADFLALLFKKGYYIAKNRGRKKCAAGAPSPQDAA